MTDQLVTRIEIDLAANTLWLVLDDSTRHDWDVSDVEQLATVDMGVGGRLIGVALGDIYLPVMEPEPGTEALVRSASIDVIVTFEPDRMLAIGIPRRGEGYEITYPSGNQ